AGGQTQDALWISARTGSGLDRVHRCLQAAAGGMEAAAGGEFTARARHVQALRRTAAAVERARGHLRGEALELVAEALRESHDVLGTITGRVAPDDLLG